MKVALAISGQPRFAKITYDYWYKDLIANTNADVFLHTWWAPDMVGTLYPSHAKKVLFDEDMLVTENIITDLNEMYKPKKFRWDGYQSKAFTKTNQFQYSTQYYVSELVREFSEANDINYDIVIRSRFDLAVGQDIEFTPDNSVWVASCCPYTDGRVNDMFSISNYDNFLKISQTFLNLDEYDANGKGEMEWALASQIQKERLEIKKFHAEYETFDIVRSTSKHQFVGTTI